MIQTEDELMREANNITLMAIFALAYKNGSITELLLKEVCQANGWDYKKDFECGVLIRCANQQ